MNKARRLVVLNIVTSFVYKIVIIAYGFIIPKLIISHYGSEAFGWLKSIIQFLSFVHVCDFGIGAVIKANLYKPLYNNDNIKISKIVKASSQFFQRIGIIFLIYTFVLIFVYPLFHSNVFSFSDTAMMISIVSIGTFSQYFFGISNQLLLEADQKGYVNNIIGIISTLIVTVFCVILIDKDFSLLVIRIAYAAVFSIRPLCLFLYTKYFYNLRLDEIILYEEPIKQKWHGFSFHIANLVQNNACIILLTVFSVIENVSIYSVYHLVTNGLSVVASLFISSITPIFGRINAAGNRNILREHFDRFEWFMHFMVCCLFSTCSVAIVPFVRIYTRGITDVDYIRWDFGILLVIATAIFCFCQLYLLLIYVDGRFKETEKYILLVPIINVVLSMVFVVKYGLIGVVIGMLISLLYKLIFLLFYLSSHIIYKKINDYLKIFFMDTIIVCSVVGSSCFIVINDVSYTKWFVSMLSIGGIAVITSILVSIVLFKETLKWFVVEMKTILMKNSIMQKCVYGRKR